MTRRIWIACIVIILVILAVFRIFGQRNRHIDKEESGLQQILQNLLEAEQQFYSEHRIYTADSEVFESLQPHRPTLIGLIPNCQVHGAIVFRFFGPTNTRFESHARQVIAEEIVKNQCRNLVERFTAVAAQNLDEDDDFELWSIDETGKTSILLED